MSDKCIHGKIIRLINNKFKQELWDPNNKNNHLKNKKYDTWQKIASSLLSSFRENFKQIQ